MLSRSSPRRDVDYRRLPDRMIECTCAARHDDGAEHTWLLSLQRAAGSVLVEEGVTGELVGPLLACVLAGEVYVEYGIVEYRLQLAHPNLFAAHVRDRGHAMLRLGAGTPTASTSGSASPRAGWLARRARHPLRTGGADSGEGSPPRDTHICVLRRACAARSLTV